MRLPSVLVLSCLLAAASSAGRGGRANCRDYADRPGTCGHVKDCPALMRILSGGRQPSKQEVSQLRRSRCSTGRRSIGRRSAQVLLCCALAPPPTPPMPPAPVRPFTGPPEEHPNRPLLDPGESCGDELKPRITGGKQALHGRHPWMALLGYRDVKSGEVSYRCGGALIGTQHVLTAAHCLVDLPAPFRLHSVRLGDHNLSRPTDCGIRRGRSVCGEPQEFSIGALFIHRDYHKPSRRLNDLALLKLDRPVVENDFVGKICLPFGEARRRNYTGVSLMATGFGQVGFGRDSLDSEVLMEVTLPGVEQRTCAAALRRLGSVLGPRQLCAGGERGRDVCFGDSGGPLVADPGPGQPEASLVGVVAYGGARCDGTMPSVFTRVSAYLNWILDRVAD